MIHCLILVEPRFIWSEDSAFKFQEALLSNDIQQNVKLLENEQNT
jgi:hypothetical protein